MFEGLLNSIESGFSNLPPSNFCVPCFIKGFLEGAAIGLATLALIATAPGWLAVALAVGLAALGAYGIYQLAKNWSRMPDNAKSEALGGIAGGLIAGTFEPAHSSHCCFRSEQRSISSNTRGNPCSRGCDGSCHYGGASSSGTAAAPSSWYGRRCCYGNDRGRRKRKGGNGAAEYSARNKQSISWTAKLIKRGKL